MVSVPGTDANTVDGGYSIAKKRQLLVMKHGMNWQCSD